MTDLRSWIGLIVILKKIIKFEKLNPTQPISNTKISDPTQPNPTQSNPWMNPTHVHVCVELMCEAVI